MCQETLWVKQKNNNAIIQVPKGHVWVECECEVPSKQCNLDSITSFGPVPSSLIVGEVKAIVWPLWRIQSFEKVELEAKM